jgi:transposase-like protein
MKIIKCTCPKCGSATPLVSEGYEGNIRELQFKCSCGYSWWIPAYFISTGKVQVVV